MLFRSDYNPVNGNQPKKLKGKYIYLEKKSQAQNDKSLVILERTPEQRIIFHHRRGEDALLYSQTALKEGQIFGFKLMADDQIGFGILRSYGKIFARVVQALRFPLSETLSAVKFGRLFPKRIFEHGKRNRICIWRVLLNHSPRRVGRASCRERV